MRSVRILLGVLLVCSLAFAQHHHTVEPSPEIDVSKLPPAVKIAGLGQSHIAITTKSADAQQWFDQGLALLHSFWDYEALRAFEQAIRLDPDCALCHWGLSRALAFGNREEAAKDELAKAKELMAKASEHERFYILAAVNEQEDKDKGKEHSTAYRDQMQKLVDQYPDDVEAKLFLIDGGLDWGYKPDGEPLPDTIYVQSMLRDILHSDPRNAAANHYYIHAVESSKHPEWALPSADVLGELAPASSHMVHMPGHIYYRVGNYEKARRIFLAALKVDEDYMQREHVSPADDWNYAHNISYLISACAEEGRFQEAAALLARLQGLSDNPDRSNNPPFYIFQIAATGARLNLRFAQWGRVIENPLRFGVADSELDAFARAYRDGLVAYARGMQALESGDFQGAAAASDQLDALLWRTSREEPGDKQKGLQRNVGRILSIASFELRGNIASRRDRFEEARELLKIAVKNERETGYSEPPSYSRPALESLGYACIRAGQWVEAREAFRQVLEERPKSGFGLYGIALAYEKQGDREKAAQAYRDFLDAWKNADPDLAQVQAARTFLAQDRASR
ncbi:MAG TPA: tetratricopeptide repeat protein [Bryobacteraceae bacterium]|nr:tetratricopeptide repeat protein [Bryobacteraceae bacterium]